MRCPNCQTINSPNAKFCLECGNRLLVCPNCGTVNVPFAKFCIECGTLLRVDTSASTVNGGTGSGHDQSGRDTSRPYHDGNGNATEALPDIDTIVTLSAAKDLAPAGNENTRAGTVFEG